MEYVLRTSNLTLLHPLGKQYNLSSPRLTQASKGKRSVIADGIAACCQEARDDIEDDYAPDNPVDSEDDGQHAACMRFGSE